MVEELDRLIYQGLEVNFRRKTSDLDTIVEVLINEGYANEKLAFDVEPNEVWLDLGANIGAFALYCKRKGAVAHCFEMDHDCFLILKRNVPDFHCVEGAVVARSDTETIPYYVSKNPLNQWRGTVVHTDRSKMEDEARHRAKVLLAPGCFASAYDGVKMDIEGAEMDILDQWALPKCNKLVLEYHTCIDSSMENLKRRLNEVRKYFRDVFHDPVFDPVFKRGDAHFAPEFDTLIFAKERVDK